MRIIAFDSSLKRSAWAAWDGVEYQWEARSFIKPADKQFPYQRFNEWREWAKEALDNVFGGDLPTLCVYEAPTTRGQGSGEAQIMLMMTLRELCAVRRIPMECIYPAHLKRFVTGRGDADKADMMAVVAARVPDYSGIDDPGGDVADSLAMILWALAGAPISEAAEKKARRKTAVQP